MGMSRFSTNVTGLHFNAFKARGTAAAPLPTVSGDDQLLIRSYGRSSNGVDVESARIHFDSEGTIGDGRVPGQIRFFTSPDVAAPSLTERFRLSANGDARVFNLNGTGNAPVYATSNGTLYRGSKPVYSRETGTFGSTTKNAWVQVPGVTQYMDVLNGDFIKFDGMMFVRLTSGSNNDYFYFRIRIEGTGGCGSLDNTQIGYFHADEDGGNHDNFKPIPITDYWVCNCTGQVRFSYQIYMQGDDNWEAMHRTLIATRY
jgi:hypothetical protein